MFIWFICIHHNPIYVRIPSHRTCQPAMKTPHPVDDAERSNAYPCFKGFVPGEWKTQRSSASPVVIPHTLIRTNMKNSKIWKRQRLQSKYLKYVLTKTNSIYSINIVINSFDDCWQLRWGVEANSHDLWAIRRMCNARAIDRSLCPCHSRFAMSRHASEYSWAS